MSISDYQKLFTRLGLTAFKVDLHGDAAVSCLTGFDAGAKPVCWSTFLADNRDIFNTEMRTDDKLTCEALLKEYEAGHSESAACFGRTVRVVFDRRRPERPTAFVVLHQPPKSDVQERLIHIFVYSVCDYFIVLDVPTNSYFTFGISGHGDPLPPAHTNDYEAVVQSYAVNWMVEEDRDRVVREMLLDHVVAELDRHGVHNVYMGLKDPVRGYARKRLEYRWFDRERRRILLCRYDVTDVWEDERRRRDAMEKALTRASTDALTGLLNAQAIGAMVNQTLMTRRKNARTPASALLFVDLDNFKAVNDTFGHQTGDELLKQIAAILREATGNRGHVARIGGDEFVVFLPEVGDPAEASGLAHLLCSRVAETNRAYGVSGSVGIAMVGEDIQSYEELIARADAALYDTKLRGKNDFSVFRIDPKTTAD